MDIVEKPARRRSRRWMLTAAAGSAALGAAALVGCVETEVVTETKIQTVEVEKPVDRVVTREVIRDVPVERVVTKEVEVERVVTKEVPVERVVTRIVEKVVERSPDAGRADEFVWVNGEIFYGLDPVHEFSASYMLWVGLAETLMTVDDDGSIIPWLAESYELVNANTASIALRQNATFWSGAPVNAEAVKASLERSIELAPPAAALLKDVNIEVAGDWELRFEGDAPIPQLPFNLTDPWLAIHNAASYGPADNAFDIDAADLTGPYRLVEFKPREEALLELWDGYWGTQPNFSTVRYREVPDPQARALIALSGEADMVKRLPSETAALVRASDKVDLALQVGTGTASMYLNLQRPPFDDRAVREAIGWALDRNEIVELAWSGLAKPASSWLSTNAAYPEAAEIGFTEYDPERAGQILDEAGWVLGGDGIRAKDGNQLKFRYLWWGTEKPVAEVIQEQLKRIGISIEVIGSPDYGVLDGARASGDWEALVEGWGHFGDPFSPLDRHFGANGDINYGRYRSDEMDALFAEFADAISLDERRKIAVQINELVFRDVILIPLYARARIAAVSSSLAGYKLPSQEIRVLEITPELSRK